MRCYFNFFAFLERVLYFGLNLSAFIAPFTHDKRDFHLHTELHKNHRCAVFPLTTPILPGCVLPLRIFEARYLDMVSQCLREARSFVIVQARTTEETDTSSVNSEIGLPFFRVGTQVNIIDFDRGSDGLLSIMVSGTTRVSLSEATQSPSGLWYAAVSEMPERGALPIDNLHRLRDLLVQLLQHDETRVFLNHIDIKNQEQVMNHLVMLLPLSTHLKQALLEADDLAVRWKGLEQALENLEQQAV